MSDNFEVLHEINNEENKEFSQKKALDDIIVSFLSRKNINSKKLKNSKNFLEIKQKLFMKKNNIEGLVEIQKDLINICNEEEKL
ncbi:MAG: hypothetical protein WCT85_04655 [Parachlamydiales bacterium]|jgi:hypothetical protein